jgi:isopropylmalate/homocitrate/citramalate synthase
LEATEDTIEDILESFDLSIQWIRDAWQKRGIERGSRNGRVYINIYDTFEAFYRNTDIYVRVIKYLGAHPGVDGILYEDEIGTSFHFQVAEITKLIRSLVPAPKKLLAHLHDNTGTMYASALEAVLNGADGLWAGFTPMGGMLNSSASSVFLANLRRVGNDNVENQYNLKDTIPLARKLDALNQPGISTDYCHPVIGEGAYQSTLRGFEQREGEHMALPPEVIGAKRGFRVVPAIANNYAMSSRLNELGIHYPSEPSGEVLGGKQLQNKVYQKIWDLMQESLIAGCKVDCNDEQVLRQYLDQARRYFREQEAG